MGRKCGRGALRIRPHHVQQRGQLRSSVEERPIYEQKPLPRDIELVDGSVYSWGHRGHALDRIVERNIGVYEVFAALVEPELVLVDPKDPDIRKYYRGDIEVVFDEPLQKICTVAYRNDGEDWALNRKALAPNGGLVNNIAAALPADTRAALEKIAEPPTPEKVVERTADKMPTEEIKAPAALGFSAAVEEVLKSLPPGTVTSTPEIYQALPARLRIFPDAVGAGRVSSIIHPSSRFRRGNMIAPGKHKGTWIIPFPQEEGKVPEQPGPEEQLLEILDSEPADLGPVMSLQTPEVIEAVGPGADLLDKFNSIQPRKAVRNRAQALAELLDDIGWKYELTQNGSGGSITWATPAE